MGSPLSPESTNSCQPRSRQMPSTSQQRPLSPLVISVDQLFTEYGRPPLEINRWEKDLDGTRLEQVPRHEGRMAFSMSSSRQNSNPWCCWRSASYRKSRSNRWSPSLQRPPRPRQSCKSEAQVITSNQPLMRIALLLGLEVSGWSDGRLQFWRWLHRSEQVAPSQGSLHQGRSTQKQCDLATHFTPNLSQWWAGRRAPPGGVRSLPQSSTRSGVAM